MLWDSYLMWIFSPSFQHSERIPSQHTCDGANTIPPLQFSEVPEEAKSLALIVDDPDAPMEGSFVHWVIWNIDPSVQEIAENSIPSGAVQGVNDFGNIGYGGPCPPSGDHRYQFKLYALDKKLDLEKGAKKAEVEAAMEGSVLENATLMGLYSRE